MKNKKLDPLVRLLFYDTYLVDELEKARAMAKEYGSDRPALRFVASSGEWADGAGRVHGGGMSEDNRSTSRIGRRERLDELDSDIKTLAARRLQQANRIEQLRSEATGIAVGDIRMKVRESEQVRARLDQERARI